MTRHVSADDIASILRRGREVEALCGAGTRQGTLRWVSLRTQKDAQVRATVFEVVLPGDLELLDVYEFEPAPGTNPEGVLEQRTFSQADEAIAYLSSSWGVDSSRFVNAGVVQDEYYDYARSLVGKTPQ